MTIRQVDAVTDAEIDALTDVLIDCVEGGASISFVLPLGRDRAAAFWRRVAASVAAGERVLLVAEDGAGVCGTVQLVIGLPENQPHRGDVSKLLVHRRARGRGVGEALMRAVDDVARAHGRDLLVLDTETGSPASRLYERLGWRRAGDVPRFALLPDGRECSTTYYYRDLRPGR